MIKEKWGWKFEKICCFSASFPALRLCGAADSYQSGCGDGKSQGASPADTKSPDGGSRCGRQRCGGGGAYGHHRSADEGNRHIFGAAYTGGGTGCQKCRSKFADGFRYGKRCHRRPYGGDSRGDMRKGELSAPFFV